jgi:hypothetical protein
MEILIERVSWFSANSTAEHCREQSPNAHVVRTCLAGREFRVEGRNQRRHSVGTSSGEPRALRRAIVA